MKSKIVVDNEKLKGMMWGKMGAVANQMNITPLTLSLKINNPLRMTVKNINDIARLLNRPVGDFVEIVQLDKN